MRNKKSIDEIADDEKILFQNFIARRICQKSALIQFYTNERQGQNNSNRTKATGWQISASLFFYA